MRDSFLALSREEDDFSSPCSFYAIFQSVAHTGHWCGGLTDRTSAAEARIRGHSRRNMHYLIKLYFFICPSAPFKTKNVAYALDYYIRTDKILSSIASKKI